jgi:hypothetical protein
MAISADYTIPAFSGHATVSLVLLSSGEKFMKNFRQKSCREVMTWYTMARMGG